MRGRVRFKYMIVCKSPAEIEKMRRAGHVVRQVLEAVRAMVAPGVSTMDLELAAEAKIAPQSTETISPARKTRFTDGIP